MSKKKKVDNAEEIATPAQSSQQQPVNLSEAIENISAIPEAGNEAEIAEENTIPFDPVTQQGTDCYNGFVTIIENEELSKEEEPARYTVHQQRKGNTVGPITLVDALDMYKAFISDTQF